MAKKRNIIVGQSGGPTAVINSSLAGVYKNAIERGFDKVYGMLHGIQGLLDEQYIDLSTQIHSELDIELLKRTPSAFLGSCRYKLPEIHEDKAIYEKIFEILNKLNIECFIYIGGNDSMDTIKKLSDYAILTGQSQKFVGVPKTIDNDLWGSDLTFGFHSAVDVATNAIDCIHTTAASHGRVFIVEIMGHKVGWLALYAGIAGGADIILLPEIPYDIDVVVNAIRSRTKNGKNFTILAVAEGAISKENAALTKKELKEKKKNGPVYPSVAYELGAQISERTGQEIRVTVPGHMQRGGEPCPYDRVIATRLGAEAAEMIRRKEYGYMVALNNNKIEKIPLADIAGKLKMVDPKSDIIREAKDVGISFGDE